MNAVELVNVLIDKRADINASNRYGHNPLTWAATCGHAEVVASASQAEPKSFFGPQPETNFQSLRRKAAAGWRFDG